jgi:hypothetical protein
VFQLQDLKQFIRMFQVIHLLQLLFVYL